MKSVSKSKNAIKMNYVIVVQEDLVGWRGGWTGALK
jgi:hypothetical protein